MTVDAVYQVTHEAEALGQRVINTTYWRPQTLPQTNPPDTALINLVLILDSRWYENFTPLFHANYTYRRTVIREVVEFDIIEDPNDPETFKNALVFGRQFLETVHDGANGATTGDPLPLLVAAVCHWNSNMAGRRHRGRLKLSPFVETDSTGDQMTTALRGTLAAGMNTYRAGYTTIPDNILMEQVVFSPTSFYEQNYPGIPRDAAVPIASVTVTPTWGVQRSRKFNTNPG